MTLNEARGDDGFTLIELVMALTVLALAIFGIASVFGASIRTGAVDIHRGSAIALATKANEQMATVPYAALGMADGATSPACDLGKVVVPVDPPGVTPTETITPPGGITYTINRCVVWVADSAGTSTTAYKRTTVEISWTDEVGLHTVRQDSASYPGGLGPATPTSTTTTTVCSGPPGPSTFPLLATRTTSVTFRLTWPTPSSPVDGWRVQYSAASVPDWTVFVADQPSVPTGQTNVSVISGLSPNTTYEFAVVALACGSESAPGAAASALATGSGVALPPCTVTLVNVTPSVARRVAGTANLAAGSVTVAVSTNGSCSTVTASYTPTVGATPPSTVALSQVGAGPNEWEGVLPAGSAEAWDLGPHSLSILANGLTVAQATFCVVNGGGGSC